MDSGREGVIPLDDKELKKFAKFININDRYRFFNDDNDLIKIQQEVIDQLTNNWNELEEWLKSVVEYETLHKGNYMTVRGEWAQEVLDKMKEIKENNK